MRTIDVPRGGGPRTGYALHCQPAKQSPLDHHRRPFCSRPFGAYIAPANPWAAVFLSALHVLNLGLIFADQRCQPPFSPGLALVMFYGFTGHVDGSGNRAPCCRPTCIWRAARRSSSRPRSPPRSAWPLWALVAQIARFQLPARGKLRLSALCSVLLVLGVLSMFVHFVSSPGLYAWATLAIFSVLLLVDFMRLRDGGQGPYPVAAFAEYLHGRAEHLHRPGADFRQWRGTPRTNRWS